jgi:prepilin-type N-terminal cleavage/methylation domain-containing protein
MLQDPYRPAPRGFTLIELLVVMAIIATLAGLGAVGIPRFLRERDITVAKTRLSEIHKAFVIYQGRHGGLSPKSGPAFVLSIWDEGIVDHTRKDAEIFFDPGAKAKPEDDLSNVTPEGISWTGPNQEGLKVRLGIQDRNANNRVIVCNRLPEVIQSQEDIDLLPHAGKGIVYLTLGGAVEFIESSKFGGEYPIIGPNSPRDEFKWMVPDDQ